MDDNALNFNPLVEMVRYGTFSLRLPSVFSTPQKPKADEAVIILKRKGHQDVAEGKKKKEYHGEPKEQKNKVTNPEPPIEAFKLRPG